MSPKDLIGGLKSQGYHPKDVDQQDRPIHMKGASGCRQTVMYDPGAQQPSQMLLTGKGQTTGPGIRCPTL